MNRQNRWRLAAVLAVMLALMPAAGCRGAGAAKSGGAAPAEMTATRGYEVRDSALQNRADGEYEYAEEPAGAVKPEAPETGGEQAASSQAKIIRTQDYTMETVDFDQALAGLKTRPAAYGGYIESSEHGTNVRGLQWAQMVIRVPAANLDAFAEGLAEASLITHFSETTENVTLRYVDLESHIDALRAEQEALLQMLAKADDLQDMLYIQSHLTDVRYEIESYERQLRVLADQVDYSTVRVSLTEVVREQNTDKTFWGEAGSELSDTLYRIGQDLRSFAISVIGNAPQILLGIAVIVVIVLAVRRKVRRMAKKQEQTPGDAPEQKEA